MNVTINFDMDGTLLNFYGVKDWLTYLENEDTTPYEIAKPLVRMNALAKRLNNLQKRGYKIAIISWLSKCGTPEYNEEVTLAKLEWLTAHLPSVKWDRITIVPHGTPKYNYCDNENDILFDDEKLNRDTWNGTAYDVNEILEILATL